MPDAATDQEAGWVEALDELEAALGVLAAGGVAPWSPPVDLGPLPAALAGRARALQAGQLELIAELSAARRATAEHLAALRAIPAAPRDTAAVYLDVAT